MVTYDMGTVERGKGIQINNSKEVIVELLNTISGICNRHDQNNDEMYTVALYPKIYSVSRNPCHHKICHWDQYLQMLNTVNPCSQK